MPPPPETVAAWLQSLTRDLHAAGLRQAANEAAWLTAGCLGVSVAALWRNTTQPLPPERAAHCQDARRRRLAGEPLAYILGEAEFYGLTLAVGPGTLIPRPETEGLVELALKQLPAPDAAAPPLLILDACTGSGAIACALAAQRSDTRVFAMELHGAALVWACRNRDALNLTNLHLWQGDLLDAVAPTARFDLIVANPPYIPEAAWPELEPDVRDHEPVTALLAAEHGLAVLRRLAAQAARHLAPEAWLLCEIGHDQETTAPALLQACGLRNAHARRDLFGQPRYVLGQR
jgi:release factor glutamine methyltransferase